MTNLLAYFPSPPRGVWHLGPVPIRAYALFIIVGIVVALLIGDRRWENRGGERGVIYDIALWAVPFGLVGGRLYHLATDWRTYFGGGGAGLGAAAAPCQGALPWPYDPYATWQPSFVHLRASGSVPAAVCTTPCPMTCRES